MTLISLSVFSQSAQAAIIGGLTASTPDMNATGSLIHLIDGSGLASNTPALTGIHSVTDSTNSWTNNFSAGNILFDFKSVYTLAGFSFWNNTSFSPNQGVQGVTIATSLDGITYSALQGITGSTAFNTTTGVGTFAQGIANTVSGPQQFTVTATDARYLRLNITSNYGGDYTGFNEIQFDSAPVSTPSAVPEPLTMLGAATAVGFGAMFKRRVNEANKK